MHILHMYNTNTVWVCQCLVWCKEYSSLKGHESQRKKSQSERLHRARSSARTWVFSQLPAAGCQTILWRRIGQSGPFLWKLFTVRTREDSLRSVIFGHRIGFFSPFFVGVWCCLLPPDQGKEGSTPLLSAGLERWVGSTACRGVCYPSLHVYKLVMQWLQDKGVSLFQSFVLLDNFSAL